MSGQKPRYLGVSKTVTRGQWREPVLDSDCSVDRDRMRVSTVSGWFLATGLFHTCLVLGLEERHLAESYLARFGYLRPSSGKTGALQTLDSAVTRFQAFAGLEQTGELDRETVNLMREPRCGVKDIVEEDEDTPRQWLGSSQGACILQCKQY